MNHTFCSSKIRDMSNIRFDQIGSLFRKDGSYVTGKCLYPSLFWQSRDEFDEEDIPRGPFTEAESFYKALISALFVHVKELSMEHHLFHGPVPVPEEYDDFQGYRIATDRWNDYVAVESKIDSCLLYTSPSPRDVEESRMPSSA